MPQESEGKKKAVRSISFSLLKSMIVREEGARGALRTAEPLVGSEGNWGKTHVSWEDPRMLKNPRRKLYAFSGFLLLLLGSPPTESRMFYPPFLK